MFPSTQGLEFLGSDVLNLEQGSKEWLNWRAQGIGSSEIASIMGLNPYKSAYQVWLEKTKKVEPENISHKKAVQRGIRLEPKAREEFENITGQKFDPVVFMMEGKPQFRYSSDGYSKDTDEVIEIKCMSQQNHEKVIATQGFPLEYYYPQVQWALMISKAKCCWFISYRPEHKNPIVFSQNKADPDFFIQMQKKADEFWECVIKDVWTGPLF